MHLPRLPTDRLHRRISGVSWLSRASAAPEAAAPLAVFARVGGGFRLTAVDARATALGLAPDLPVADARARVPGLGLVERDADGEAATLAAIADWCDRFTPLVGLDDAFDAAAGLFLDATGVAHLFGGEEALAAELVRDLAARGFTARVAIAGAPAAARALARHGVGPATTRVLPPGEETAALSPLPVAAIDPDGARVARLARLGLARVGDLLALPRAGLARRFGQGLLDRLDEAVGRLDRPISPRLPPPVLVAERRLAEPILSAADVATVLRSLAESLVETLERRGEGLRLAEAALWRLDGAVRRIRVGTGRPIRDPDRLLVLFAERLAAETDEIDLGFGIDLVRLSVLLTGRDDPAQIDWSGDEAARRDFDHLVDRLGARLGPDRVLASRPRPRHRPEAAVAPVAVGLGRDAARAWATEPGPARDEPPARPLRLLARPEPIDALAELPDGPPLRFRWRRALYEVACAEGPERIAAEWWRLPFGLGPEGAPASADDARPAEGDAAPEPRLDLEAATRDYFRVEARDGRRFWIFRAGLFARETLRPRWFLHGLFA
ncbi:MAG: DNA polymerase Y family protein [Hyphomicrobiales bacterium]|nr:DNA polymerase Y family protein [Hyphomicrobiales bacterium]